MSASKDSASRVGSAHFLVGRMIPFLVLCDAILISPNWVGAAESGLAKPTPISLLSGWQHSLASLDNSVCTTEQLESVQLPGAKKAELNFQTEEYWRDRNGRLASHRRAWDNLAAPDSPRDPHAGLHETMIYDLNRLYTLDKSSGSRPQAGDLTIRDKPDPSKIRQAALGLNIEGFFDEPGLQSLPAYLLSEGFRGSMHLRPLPETVGGSKCLVLDIKGDFGSYFIWIDPSHGDHAARLELRQRTGDRVGGRALPLSLGRGKPDVISCDLTYQVRNFKRIDGVWEVTSASYHYVSSFRDGSRSVFDRTIKRMAIQLNPDFDKLEVFEPNFPNGARVLDGTGRLKTWKDGKVVP